jgi:hypothetical protein
MKRFEKIRNHGNKIWLLVMLFGSHIFLVGCENEGKPALSDVPQPEDNPATLVEGFEVEENVHEVGSEEISEEELKAYLVAIGATTILRKVEQGGPYSGVTKTYYSDGRIHITVRNNTRVNGNAWIRLSWDIVDGKATGIHWTYKKHVGGKHSQGWYPAPRGDGHRKGLFGEFHE